jgi:hypothetical protein
VVASSVGDMWWRSRLRHCAKTKKVAGSVSDGIFDRTNPSGSTMTLGLTHSLTEISKVKQSRYKPGVAQRVPGS